MGRTYVGNRLTIAVCAAVVAVGLALPVAPIPVSAQPGEGGGQSGGPQEPRPGSQVIGDGIVVAGQRIGPLRLTMPIDAMIAAVGRRPKRDEIPADGIILYEWRAEGVWISQSLATKAVRVISVFGTSDRYKTDKNVSLLQTRSRVEAMYGKGYKEYDYASDRITLIRYHDIGLQFGLVNQPSNPTIHNRIFQIGIFKPGDLPPLRRPTR
jgi:hypothetical protein